MTGTSTIRSPDRVLDVTSLGLHDQPLGQLELGTRLTEVEIADGQTTIRGEVVNPLGHIPASLRRTRIP